MFGWCEVLGKIVPVRELFPLSLLSHSHLSPCLIPFLPPYSPFRTFPHRIHPTHSSSPHLQTTTDFSLSFFFFFIFAKLISGSSHCFTAKTSSEFNKVMAVICMISTVYTTTSDFSPAEKSVVCYQFHHIFLIFITLN
ncbi:hypothetical protein AMTRI_Chr06g199820 [Amborella trichopoda]